MQEVLLRLSADERTARLVFALMVLPSNFITAIALHFVIFFTGSVNRRLSNLFLSVVYPVTLIMGIYQTVFPGQEIMIFTPSVGWSHVPGDWIGKINSLWVSFFALMIPVVLIGYYRRISHADTLKRSQALIVLGGILIPVLVGVVYEVLLPVFFRFQVLPVTSSLTLLFTGSIFLALTRYRLFEVSPGEAFPQILDNMNEGVLIMDNGNRIRYANGRILNLLGYRREDLVGGPGGELFFRPEKEKSDLGANDLQDRLELQMVRKDGRRVWTEISFSPIIHSSAGKEGSIALIADITRRREAEIRLVDSEKATREFARHLNDALENERAHIAREIHDELGQLLIGFKLGLTSFKKYSAESTDLNQRIDGMLHDVDNSIQSLRKIATSLRPGILDTVGLVPSLQWLANEFSRKSGLACRVKFETSEQKFPRDVSTCFFRVAQEAFNNIAKHSDATHVEFLIQQNAGILKMMIKDNGIGIQPGILENPFSMGLLGMRERAAGIGAKLEVLSSVGDGTSVQLEVGL